MSRYRWDPGKAHDNLAKHGVSFEEAETVPGGGLAKWFSDRAHSDVEERSWVIGPSSIGRLLLVVTSESGPRPRIISAWRATKRERREYEGR
jgi:Uncharacterized protein conserved in bacteria